MIKDDLSIWLNRKHVDLFVVSTGPELESIVGDGTTYGYTGKETRLTGLPRFDRLLRKAARGRAPTTAPWSWSRRRGGRGSPRRIDPETFQRELDSGLVESRYWHEWAAILRSPRIAERPPRPG